MDYRIYPLGESAATMDFGNEISVEKNERVINLANRIENNNFKGFIECVPAYASLSLFYDPVAVRKSYPEYQTALDFVRNFLEEASKNLSEKNQTEARIIEIPVSFEKESALDLEFVAEKNKLATSEVIEIFISKTYRVFMLGFLPGFAYMGELDKRIATPRKETPRTKVSKGSVGIAGTQTGIYPLESPGGWQIIGGTDAELFKPQNESPTLFQAGDLVKFVKL